MSEQQVYEIVNPSDPYTMVASDDRIAALACIILGGGKYCPKNRAGESSGPFFMFGDSEALFGSWLRETFPRETAGSADVAVVFAAVMAVHGEAVAAALESVLIGGFKERDLVTLALSKMPDPVDQAEYLAKLHDVKRTSMNDIGTRALELAKRTRRRMAEVSGS